MTTAVYIVDRIVSTPGGGRDVYDAYMADYAPGAKTRGMVLVYKIVSPPLWLTDGENRLIFVWRLEGAAGFWRKNNLGRRDPAVLAFWAQLDEVIQSRTRDTLGDPDDFQSLAAV